MLLTIEKTFALNGAPADPTAVVLSDSTAAYGVRLASGGTIVVAGGTAMTRIAAGLYRATFTATAGATYEYVVAVTVDGSTNYFAGTITAGGDGLSVTLAEARAWCHIDSAQDDATLADLIQAAEAYVQNYTGIDFDTDPPDTLLKTAVKQLVAQWFEFREPVISGTIATELPLGVMNILNQYPNRYTK